MNAKSVLPSGSKKLIDAILEGNCVAFVGSGFSASAGYSDWKGLLKTMTGQLLDGEPRKCALHELLNRKEALSNRDLEMAAQLLFDTIEIKPGDFQKKLSEAFKVGPENDGRANKVSDDRLKFLHGIPFKAIVTTNFDPLILGEMPCAGAYLKLLRGNRRSPWEESMARAAVTDLADKGKLGLVSGAGNPIVMQLHGSINGDQSHLVFTRSQYRERLYANPAYLTILRSLLATSTVLFLGYSLTDAYLNEIRSELVQAFREKGGSEAPLAWAILNDVSDVAQSYYKEHEGLGVINFSSNQGKDFGQFDRILGELFAQTNQVARLGGLLANNRILWLDPKPENNDVGRLVFEEAAKLEQAAGALDRSPLVQVKSLEDAIAHLKNDGEFALVLTHWGHSKEVSGTANAELLLRQISRMRGDGILVPPVIVFAGKNGAIENRKRALSLGAVAFHHEWEKLMESVEFALQAPFAVTYS